MNDHDLRSRSLEVMRSKSFLQITPKLS